MLTGEVRLSYANLTKPRAMQQGSEEKYSVTLLIPKTDAATVTNIKSSIEAAAQEAQGKLWGGFRPPNLESILHDGDGVKEKTGQPYGPECKGHWVLNAGSKNKPGVVHQSDINTDLLPQDIYSGMYARVTLNFYGYAHSQGGRGIGCGLGNVMKTQDGEPLAGGASAEADFAGVGSIVTAPDQPAYAAPQPTAYAPPPAYVPPTAPWAAGPGNVNPLTGQPW